MIDVVLRLITDKYGTDLYMRADCDPITKKIRENFMRAMGRSEEHTWLFLSSFEERLLSHALKLYLSKAFNVVFSNVKPIEIVIREVDPHEK